MLILQTDSSLHGSQSDFAYSITHLSATEALDSKWQLKNSAFYYSFSEAIAVSAREKSLHLINNT